MRFQKDAVSYFKRAERDFAERQLDDAIANYTKAIELNPQFIAAYLGRACVKWSIDDDLGAIEDYSYIIEQQPDNAEAYQMRALERARLKDCNGAIADATMAIELNPHDNMPYMVRASIKMEVEDFAGTISDYTLAMKVPNADIKSAIYGRANAKAKIGDYRGAINDYTLEIILDPTFSCAYADRGEIYKILGDSERAQLDFRTFTKLSDEILECYFERTKK